jgi:hypothetical protein
MRSSLPTSVAWKAAEAAVNCVEPKTTWPSDPVSVRMLIGSAVTTWSLPPCLGQRVESPAVPTAWQ